MSNRISVAELYIDTYSKPELLKHISARINRGEKTFMTTLYSEFLFASMQSRETRDLLNKADIAVPDGIGVIWAEYFLSRPLTARNFYLRVLQAWWQVVYTGASILLSPRKLYRTFPEKIVGADLVWDLARMADENKFSVFLIGWPEQETRRVKKILLQRFPHLEIVGTADTTPDNMDVIDQLRLLKPDMVLCTFAPFKQERWIAQHLPELPIHFAVGLGGTFDYMLGKKFVPPKFVRKIGLEWLYRLFTQPSRLRRIFNATYGLILALVRYKVFMSLPFRRNAVAVVVNQNNQILICKRRAAPPKNGARNHGVLDDYWQFPQGGLDADESIIEGAQRELAEETGIVSVGLIGQANHAHQYHWEHAWRPLLASKYHYKGQEQFTVFFRFTGDESEISLDQHELVEYRWVAPDEVAGIIASERIPHAKAVLAELERQL